MDHGLCPNSDPVTLNNSNCKEVDFSIASSFDMINSNHNTPELVMNHIISITNMMQTYFEFVPIQYLLNDNYVSASPAADPFGVTDATDTGILLPGFIKTLSVLSAHELGHNWNCLHSDRGDAPFNIMNGGIQPNATGFGPNSMTKIINTANKM